MAAAAVVPAPANDYEMGLKALMETLRHFHHKGTGVEYLSEDSLKEICSKIVNEGTITFRDVAVAPEAVGAAVSYTVVFYGTQTGDLPLYFSLGGDNGLARSCFDRLRSSRAFNADIGFNKVIVPGDRKTGSVDHGKLNYYNILQVIRHAANHKRLELAKAGQAVPVRRNQTNLFSDDSKFYLAEYTDQIKDVPLPQGAFHLIIDPREMSNEAIRRIMANALDSSVVYVSAYALNAKELAQVGILPRNYLKNPEERKKLLTRPTNDPDSPVIGQFPVIFNSSTRRRHQGKTKKCSLKSRRVAKNTDEDEKSPILFTINIRDPVYVREMKCQLAKDGNKLADLKENAEDERVSSVINIVNDGFFDNSSQSYVAALLAKARQMKGKRTHHKSSKKRSTGKSTVLTYVSEEDESEKKEDPDMCSGGLPSEDGPYLDEMGHEHCPDKHSSSDSSSDDEDGPDLSGQGGPMSAAPLSVDDIKSMTERILQEQQNKPAAACKRGQVEVVGITRAVKSRGSKKTSKRSGRSGRGRKKY